MTPESSENQTFLKGVLTHYSKRLSELRGDEEIQIGNAPLSSDIDAEIVNVENALKEVGIERFYVPVFFSDKERKRVSCIALLAYVKDLKESRDTLHRKLGGKPEMKNIESEIKKAESLLRDFCA